MCLLLFFSRCDLSVTSLAVLVQDCISHWLTLLFRLDSFAAAVSVDSVEFEFDLEVYNHKPNFAKMSPGQPDYYLCVW